MKNWVFVEYEEGEEPKVSLHEKEDGALAAAKTRILELLPELMMFDPDVVGDVGAVKRALEHGWTRKALALWEKLTGAPVDFMVIEREVQR